MRNCSVTSSPATSHYLTPSSSFHHDDSCREAALDSLEYRRDGNDERCNCLYFRVAHCRFVWTAKLQLAKWKRRPSVKLAWIVSCPRRVAAVAARGVECTRPVRAPTARSTEWVRTNRCRPLSPTAPSTNWATVWATPVSIPLIPKIRSWPPATKTSKWPSWVSSCSLAATALTTTAVTAHPAEAFHWTIIWIRGGIIRITTHLAGLTFRTVSRSIVCLFFQIFVWRDKESEKLCRRAAPLDGWRVGDRKGKLIWRRNRSASGPSSLILLTADGVDVWRFSLSSDDPVFPRIFHAANDGINFFFKKTRKPAETQSANIVKGVTHHQSTCDVERSLGNVFRCSRNKKKEKTLFF